MPWVRIDEHALNHVKILALSHGAFRLWVEGLAHCQKHLTDGAISRAALRGFRYANRGRVDELVASVDGAAPLWSEQGEGFQVHDYLRWNESREHVLKVRELARTRLERHRKRVANPVANPVGSHVHNHTTTTVLPKDQEGHARVPRGRVFDGERLKVSQKQLDAIVAELGDKAGYVDFLGLMPKWDAELVAGGQPFNTLNFLRDQAEAAIKAMRAGGAFFSGADWCEHQPRCHNRTWHDVVCARERGEVA